MTDPGLATGRVTLSADEDGSVVFTPSQTLFRVDGSALYGLDEYEALDVVGGQLDAPLTATDDPRAAPVGWYWVAVFHIAGLPIEPVRFHLPAGTTVDLGALVPLGTPELPVVERVIYEDRSVVLAALAKAEAAAERAQAAAGQAGHAGALVVEFPQPIATWSVEHGLGRTPMVQTWVSGELVDAEVHADSTHASATFPSPTSGEFVLV